ncbi:MAG: DUF616 domain-containing protein, partial [Gammaproteobacteria bacterium]|nr:DUF616 domain-containing protein [Gammaproteobacteria bacterium]
LVVYTAIAADYDELRPPRVIPEGVDFVCFTERGKRVPAGWTHRVLPRSELPPASSNRYAKMHPHLLFPAHDASIYVDGNIEIIADVRPLAQRVVAEAAIGLFDHPVRSNTFDEAIECALIGFDRASRIREQMRRYYLEGYTFGGGLFEASVIVRAHHDPGVVRTMTRWWDEWQRGVKRDQLSLMYVLWKEKPRVLALGANDARFRHQYFVYHPHRQALRRAPARTLRQILNRLHLTVFGMQVR